MSKPSAETRTSPDVVPDPYRPDARRATVRHEPMQREVTIGREIGRWGDVEGDGPLLLTLGGVHGNEPAGILAALDVLAELAERKPTPRGGFVALAGNLPALDRNSRFIHQDLNRAAHPDTVARLQSHDGDEPLADTEEHELLELVRATEALVASHKGPRFVVDIHTTSGESIPYISVFELPGCVQVAQAMPTYAVVGLERALHGTLIELLNHDGWCGFTFEAGRHYDLSSVEHAWAMIWLALAAAGVVGEDDLPTDPHPRPHDVLHGTAPEGRRTFDLIHRHAVGPADEFVMRPGFVNFQPVKEGEPLADDVNGEVLCPATGRMLMPLYQKLGEDGFFLVRKRDEPA